LKQKELQEEVAGVEVLQVFQVGVKWLEKLEKSSL
jgi:hypothetical protein